MAQPKSSKGNQTKVTRIKATDDAPAKAKKRSAEAVEAEVVSTKKTKTPKTPKVASASKATAKTPVVPSAVSTTTDSKHIFVRIGTYFKGAWYELRQVRWPNRQATWALTVAVILFSLFFMGLIVLLDMFFKYIFELIIA